jgi:hypothetical protein
MIEMDISNTRPIDINSDISILQQKYALVQQHNTSLKKNFYWAVAFGLIMGFVSVININQNIKYRAKYGQPKENS